MSLEKLDRSHRYLNALAYPSHTTLVAGSLSNTDTSCQGSPKG